MPNLSGTGGRSSGVNYAAASMFDRIFRDALYRTPDTQAGAAAFAVAYQACTQGSAGSLKRVTRGQKYTYGFKY